MGSVLDIELFMISLSPFYVICRFFDKLMKKTHPLNKYFLNIYVRTKFYPSARLFAQPQTNLEER